MWHVPDKPATANNEVTSALTGEALFTPTSLDTIRLVNAGFQADLPKSFLQATVAHDGSLTLEGNPKLRQGAQGDQAPEPPEKPPQSDLDDFEHQIDASPHKKEAHDPDGTIIKTDGPHRAVTIWPDGTKMYDKTLPNGSATYVVHPDGSWWEAINDYATGKSSRFAGFPDGSATEMIDSPTARFDTKWGPGGRFLQTITTDKKTGRMYITKPGPNGDLVTEPLPET